MLRHITFDLGLGADVSADALITGKHPHVYSSCDSRLEILP
jgi:hypothetical protein